MRAGCGLVWRLLDGGDFTCREQGCEARGSDARWPVGGGVMMSQDEQLSGGETGISDFLKRIQAGDEGAARELLSSDSRG